MDFLRSTQHEAHVAEQRMFLQDLIPKKNTWSLGFGVWGLGFEVWGLGFGVRGLRFGVRGLRFEAWGLRFGLGV